MIKNIEFCLDPDGDLIYKDEDKIKTLTQKDSELIDFIINKIKDEYPNAYEALLETYKSSFKNQPYYRYLIARRFCRCNFCRADTTTKDIDEQGNFKIENPICPMFGECKEYRIICFPKTEIPLSERELDVLKMWGKNHSIPEIADALFISINTVHNHINNIYKKLTINSQSGAVEYLNLKGL